MGFAAEAADHSQGIGTPSLTVLEASPRLIVLETDTFGCSVTARWGNGATVATGANPAEALGKLVTSDPAIDPIVLGEQVLASSTVGGHAVTLRFSNLS